MKVLVPGAPDHARSLPWTARQSLEERFVPAVYRTRPPPIIGSLAWNEELALSGWPVTRASVDDVADRAAPVGYVEVDDHGLPESHVIILRTASRQQLELGGRGRHDPVEQSARPADHDHADGAATTPSIRHGSHCSGGWRRARNTTVSTRASGTPRSAGATERRIERHGRVASRVTEHHLITTAAATATVGGNRGRAGDLDDRCLEQDAATASTAATCASVRPQRGCGAAFPAGSACADLRGNTQRSEGRDL
jgi:hypothetical protein